MKAENSRLPWKHVTREGEGELVSAVADITSRLHQLPPSATRWQLLGPHTSPPGEPLRKRLVPRDFKDEAGSPPLGTPA